MFNLTRKSLTPDQMKRANITASTTITLTYLICLFITLTSDKTVIEKIKESQMANVYLELATKLTQAI